MTVYGWIQLGVLIMLVAVSTPLLGSYMARVYRGGPAPGDRVFLPVERAIYRLGQVDEHGDQRWTEYAAALLAFSLVGMLALYAIVRLQAHLPFNPDHRTGLSPGLSFNVAISFPTTTDWESYVGESTMSYLSQMLGLVVQMFLGAAVGMAVVVALIRGLVRQRAIGIGIGSFWVDLTRTVVRILLPLSVLFSVFLMSQGVIENFHGQKATTTVAGQLHDVGAAPAQSGAPALVQHIPGGPVASQDVPELLGNNGGGFFNANMAHPLQNPNGITNLFLLWMSLMIPFALPYTFGLMVGSLRQGAAIIASMFVLFAASTFAIMPLEAHGNPRLSGVTQAGTATQGGGNMEGKETRFGAAGSGLSAAVMTGTTSGAPNSELESFVPASGGVGLANMMLGEVSPGGDGSGLFGKLILAILSVFIAGLMVGRTPEYLGKKIQSTEMKLIVLYILAVPVVILGFAGASIVLDFATSKLSTVGAHGLTELTWAYTSAANGNGSSFGGISANTQWYNVTLGICMFVGRYVLVIPVLAIAASLAGKQRVPVNAGTLRTDNATFVGLLVAVTIILVGLTYLPVLALGPVVEHLARHF